MVTTNMINAKTCKNHKGPWNTKHHETTEHTEQYKAVLCHATIATAAARPRNLWSWSPPMIFTDFSRLSRCRLSYAVGAVGVVVRATGAWTAVAECAEAGRRRQGKRSETRSLSAKALEAKSRKGLPFFPARPCSNCWASRSAKILLNADPWGDARTRCKTSAPPTWLVPVLLSASAASAASASAWDTKVSKVSHCGEPVSVTKFCRKAATAASGNIAKQGSVSTKSLS